MNKPYCYSKNAPTVLEMTELQAHSCVEEIRYETFLSAIAYAFDIDINIIIELSNYDFFRIPEISHKHKNWMQYISEIDELSEHIMRFLVKKNDIHGEDFEKDDFQKQLINKYFIKMIEKYGTTEGYIDGIKKRSWGIDLKAYKPWIDHGMKVALKNAESY